LYHTRLGFLHAVHPDEIDVRTTFITRTKHVASGVLVGMDPSISECEWAVHTQPERESVCGISITAWALTAGLDRLACAELPVSSCGCPSGGGAGGIYLAGYSEEKFGLEGTP
jgi:hypothetical protein